MPRADGAHDYCTARTRVQSLRLSPARCRSPVTDTTNSLLSLEYFDFTSYGEQGTGKRRRFFFIEPTNWKRGKQFIYGR